MLSVASGRLAILHLLLVLLESQQQRHRKPCEPRAHWDSGGTNRDGTRTGRWVRSRMTRGDLYRPLPHSAFVEDTLMPSRLSESIFAAWGRERPSWPSVLVEAAKVHKSQVEWACSVFADSPPPLSAIWLLYSHPCLLFVCFLPACCFFARLFVFLPFAA